MEWLWASFSGLGAIGLAGLSRSAWRVARRFEAEGFIDNGLGTTIDQARKPKTVNAIVGYYRFYAALAFLGSAFASIVMLAWISRAL
jgi:hypothetical protein